jgi:hypothetical protein
MTGNQNPFGGKNPHGMYVPLTDVEMEVLLRLAQEGEFKLVVKGWKEFTNFILVPYSTVRMIDPSQPIAPHSLVTFGDKRISFYFSIVVPDNDSVPRKNFYFDMEVWAKGFLLFSQRMPTQIGGEPIAIFDRAFWNLALDVALDMIDPAIVKAIKPATVGLTTRQGNMHLDTSHQKMLHMLKLGEKSVRDESKQEAAVVTNKAKKDPG